MTGLSKAFEDIKRFYNIDRATKIRVSFNETSSVRFESDGREFVVLIVSQGYDEEGENGQL